MSPSICLLWLHHVGAGKDWATQRPQYLKGLFSFALGGTTCSVMPYKAHPAPGIPRCGNRVCPFSCPRAVDKLLCLDTEPQRWHCGFILSSPRILAVPTRLRRAACLRGRSSCYLLESLDFWRTSVTSWVELVFGLTNLTSHHGRAVHCGVKLTLFTVHLG